MQQIQKMAFTLEYNGKSLFLKTNASVCYGKSSANAITLWDTGASNTVISKNIVDQLNLIPIGKMSIRTPSGTDVVNTYLVNIILPNKVIVNNVTVCDSKIGDQGIDLLIGMDIITLGDFAVSNYDNKTVFSFRMPSVKRTDYVKEVNLEQLIGPRHGKGKRKKKK